MFGSRLSAVDISASGLAAERYRMEVIANNIANAHSTQTLDGGPYRRQQVVFAATLDQASGTFSGGATRGGVQVLGVELDESPFPMVFNPGHPDADANGMVRMPNVKLANEMVDLITASRSYEANVRAIRSFREMAQQALSIIGGNF